jgi:distribution and morphology protein 34
MREASPDYPWQVNPLRYALEMLATPSVLLTTAQMHVHLTLSALRLRCVIVLSFSKKGGLSLVFKDDPLESLNVSSSFDSIGVVQQVIQSVRHCEPYR